MDQVDEQMAWSGMNESEHKKLKQDHRPRKHKLRQKLVFQLGNLMGLSYSSYLL